ncbi:MAG: hypothetical protein QM692_05695 [Thermomicrobiales bacterium]
MSALRRPKHAPEPPSSVAAIPQTSRQVLEAIGAAYTFVDAEDEAKALSLLAQRPDVSAILIEALPHVVATFGEDAPVLLVVVEHHDGEPDSLAARIQSSAIGSAALEKLLAFYDDWWNEASGPVLGDLSFGA